MTRSFIRSPAGSQATPAEVATALRAALDVDRVIDILDEAEVGCAPMLVFTLAVHLRGPALIARAPNGRPLAVCSDPLVAVTDAFRALDRAAQKRRPARPSRARGRATKEQRP